MARLPALDVAVASEEAGREVNERSLELGGEDFHPWVHYLKSQFSPLQNDKSRDSLPGKLTFQII